MNWYAARSTRSGSRSSRQLNDRDRALRMLCRAADGAGQPLNGQSRGADPVRQVPQIRERPLGGKVGIGQPGRKNGLGPAGRARPRQAERITQGYQPLLRAVVQIAFQVRPRGIGRVDHELPSRAEVVDPRQRPGLDALGVKKKPRRRDRPGDRCVVDLASDPQTALAIDRIGGLTTSEPRMDSWATCHGVGIATSPTKALDGSYGITITQAEVAASGDCTDCGNAGTLRLVIQDGRYALYHPVQIDANPAEPSVQSMLEWLPDDPVEVGTITITGNRATFVPEVNQQNGSVTQTFTFELFRGLLTWHLLSGQFGWDSTHPWRKLS